MSAKTLVYHASKDVVLNLERKLLATEVDYWTKNNLLAIATHYLQ